MANETMLKFGYPATLVREYTHWVVLVRPVQVTLGSLILAAKGDATAFGKLPGEAHAELALITSETEATLSREVAYDRINYLMLMMVDPHVHFHIFPRYEGSRTIEGVTIGDAGWPGPPDLSSGQNPSAEALERMRLRLSHEWLTAY